MGLNEWIKIKKNKQQTKKQNKNKPIPQEKPIN